MHISFSSAELVSRTDQETEEDGLFVVRETKYCAAFVWHSESRAEGATVYLVVSVYNPVKLETAEVISHVVDSCTFVCMPVGARVRACMCVCMRVCVRCQVGGG